MSGRRRKPPARDSLIEIGQRAALWRDPSGKTYASIPVDGHDENWPLSSREFRRWLAKVHLFEYRTAPGAQATDDALRVLDALASSGSCHPTQRRVGGTDKAIYLDLCDDAWRVVEVTSNGWNVRTTCPIKFVRGPHMRPLPVPERGGLIESLQSFINTSDDRSFKLIVAWLAAALRPKGPYPIAVIGGEQGSSKSTATRVLRMLTDPNAAPIRSAPRDERDLAVACSNSWAQALDNLSHVPNWLSDALCRLSTGGGFSVRALHTNSDEYVFDGQRPILLNGIGDLASRADLADRAITVHLPSISEESRRSESEFWREFDSAWPEILGSLLDAVSSGLRNLPTTRLASVPRMADFAIWAEACSPGLGWDPGAFLKAYQANRQDSVAVSLEGNPVAVAIVELIETKHPEGWEGTPSNLLNELTEHAPERIRNSRAWPQSPTALGTRLERVMPLLRSSGFFVERRHSGKRIVRIVPEPSER